MILFSPRAAALCAALLLAGCASHGGGGHGSHSAADDPSNPDAPAVPAPEPFTMLKGGGPPRRAKPAVSQPAGAYVCPMHPEVTSDRPGVCPKCKMQLMPRKNAASAPAAPAEHDHGGHP